MKAVIAFGSNMGQRRKYIEDALNRIEERAGKILAVSGVVETKPYGYTPQASFLNGAVLLETELEPRRLLTVLQGIEADLDRVRLIHWGPRTIDLDIVFCDDLIIDEEDLHIPHLDVANRAFVLVPICQIAPGLVDPRSGKTVRQLYENLMRERPGIGITGVSPQIFTHSAADTIELFEALGFERKHAHVANILGLDVYTYVMRNADDFEINIAEARADDPEGTRLRINVDDFTKAYDYFMERGFTNELGSLITYTGSSLSADLNAPSGFSITLVQNIKE